MKTYILRPERPRSFTKNSSLSAQLIQADSVKSAREQAVKAAKDTDKDPKQWMDPEIVSCKEFNGHLRVCDFGIEDVEL